MLGFGDVPSWPINLIDFHGLDDDTIPYEISMSEGEGPGGTIISWDGYYYYDKMATIQTYADGMGCGPAEVEINKMLKMSFSITVIGQLLPHRKTSC